MYQAPFVPVLVGVMVAAIIRRIIRRFYQYNALNPAHALSIEELGLRRNHMFNRLIQRKVIIEPTQGRFYLDEENYARFRKDRLLIALIAIIIVFIALVLADLLNHS